jgi:hypothetical protein
MDSGDLLNLFRLEMADTEKPYLWSDDEVISYEDDAQKMFCRKTDGISDNSTPEVVQIAAVLDTDRVDLHPSILRIRSALRTDTGRPIDILNPEDMPSKNMFFDGRGGPVRVLVIGAEAHKARVWPKSSETVTIELTVFRLPLRPINDCGQPFEIDEEHHRHLMLWVKHLAYSKQDSEAYDKTKAIEFEGRFNDYCEQVKIEERRKRHKTRVVQYGGL